MGSYSFKLPDLGEGVVESEVTVWHVRVGDTVAEDDLLAEVQTDKAIVEMTSPVAGTVSALGCDAGEVLAVGAELVRFCVATDESPADHETEPPSMASTALQPVAWPSPGSHPPNATASPESSPVLTSPLLRKRAREEGINLLEVPGSGPAGRITRQDFEDFVASRGMPRTDQREHAPATKEVKIRGLRKVIARKMQASKQSIPHYSYIEEVDVTEIESLRKHLNANREAEQPRLTLLPFLMLALVKVLPRFPQCNARFDGEAATLTEYTAVHAGIATMTEPGLMVPVVRHCETLDIWQAAAEVARVSNLARDGKAAPEDLSGSTITITSLGPLGGIATTPVINAPETTIIGINKMQERPTVRSGQVVVRTMMNISASFDHRIVDGHHGAQLVQALKAKLEYPATIFV